MSRFGLGFISGEVPRNDSFTKSLHHFDGVNGSAVFTDVNAGGSAKTWSALNNIGASVLTSTKTKFGPTSLITTGIFTGIKTSPSADFNVGSGDFTVDLQYNPGGPNVSTLAVCGQGDSFLANTSICITVANDVLKGQISNGSSYATVSSSTLFNSNVFKHVAFSRLSGILLLHVDGVLESSTAAAFTVPSSSANWAVGLCGDDGALFSRPGACIDEFCFSNGIARYPASNFTPPTAAYT